MAEIQPLRAAHRALDRVPSLAARRGLFARVRVAKYGAGLVRPHERTHPAAVVDRLQLTRETHMNLSPVFALHDDAGGAVAALLKPSFTASTPHARALVADGTYDAAFFVRASPVAQVREVARAGVTMPAKSTSFSPKVPTGLLLNALDERVV